MVSGGPKKEEILKKINEFTKTFDNTQHADLTDTISSIYKEIDSDKDESKGLYEEDKIKKNYEKSILAGGVNQIFQEIRSYFDNKKPAIDTDVLSDAEKIVYLNQQMEIFLHGNIPDKEYEEFTKFLRKLSREKNYINYLKDVKEFVAANNIKNEHLNKFLDLPFKGVNAVNTLASSMQANISSLVPSNPPPSSPPPPPLPLPLPRDPVADVLQPQPMPVLNVNRPNPAPASAPPPVRNPDQILSNPLYAQYKNIFNAANTPYDTLAEIIKDRNEDMTNIYSAGGISQSWNFKKHIEHILPAVQLAALGANRELEEARKAGAPGAGNIKALEAKKEAFEMIYGMMYSLEALSNNKYRYTLKQWEDKKNKIKNAIGNDPQAHNLIDELDNIMQQQIFKPKARWFHTRFGGATEFNSYDKEFSVKEKYSKALKISHKGDVVEGTFKYNAANIFNNNAYTRDAINQLNSEVKDFVAIAMHEHGKGTPGKLINITYPDPENPTPEIAILTLMEFKRQAVLQGRELHALHDGKPITITSEPDLSPDESAYFMKYAMEVSQQKNENGKKAPVGCALFGVKSEGEAQDIRKEMEESIEKQIKGIKSDRFKGIHEVKGLNELLEDRDNKLKEVAKDIDVAKKKKDARRNR